MCRLWRAPSDHTVYGVYLPLKGDVVWCFSDAFTYSSVFHSTNNIFKCIWVTLVDRPM